MDCQWGAKETYHPLKGLYVPHLILSTTKKIISPPRTPLTVQTVSSLSKKSPKIDHTSFLKVTPPVVMIFLHLVHLVANFSSKQPTQYTSVSLGIMKGLDPTWVLHTTHWKHLSCHFRVLYSIFFIPIFNKDKIVNWLFRMKQCFLLGIAK